ncbi:hypothetical protein DSO57_1026411 [Entomophthora muscae]|uniref:Uncharacterized protein n=1 Tax=Entomophthora muscae TaxID=34485 RepID=A0ACC2UMU9_9FUNG|nr:hypothetical protein DSO57_1026411 [Entomophthora muscae]
MYMFGLFVAGVLGLATISKEVKHDAHKQKLVSVLVQLTPANIPTASYDSRLATEAEIDTFAKALYSAINRHAKRSSKGVKEILDEQVALKAIPPYRFYPISNTFAVEAQPWLIKQLASAPKVEEITSNRLVPSEVQRDDSKFSRLEYNSLWTGSEAHWSLNYINVTSLSCSIFKKAAQLRYGSADTGVEFTHPALAQNYFGLQKDGSIAHDYAWWDANKFTSDNTTQVACPVDMQTPCDDSDHGTHTTGTVVGLMNLGVSPSSKWMACKNMYNGLGSPETYLGCLQFFLAPTNLYGINPKPELRPHVIGNSYGCPGNEGCSRASFKYALRALKASGIFMSVSAGNDGRGGCSTINSPPAIDPNSFTVAATDYMSSRRARFSSLGPVPERPDGALDISAPGVNITSAIRGNRYAAFQGTSMASPHVSGAVLLIMAACPHLLRKVELVEDLLRNTATPLYPVLGCGNNTPTALPNNEFGYGIINVAQAIKQCRSELYIK